VAEVIEDILEAVGEVPSGASIAVGGFGLSGSPVELLSALSDLDRRDLHVISNNIGSGTTAGMDRLAIEGRLRKFTGSFPGGEAFLNGVYGGTIELELVPQGSLAERLRAGGAGIAAFFTPTSAGTVLGEGGFPTRFDADRNPIEYSPAKETRTIDGREYVLEEALRPDFGFVKAERADRNGNLQFHLAGRNFNPLAAMAGRRTIVQVAEIVELGEIEPTSVHLPGVYVDVLVPVKPAS
jgi:3-oxoacid CoA-transferase subunit A